MSPAAFITRDCLVDPIMPPGDETEARETVFVEGAVDGIREIIRLGYEVEFVMNAPAVSRGYLTQGTLALIHQVFIQRLKAEGVTVHGFLHCPHDADAACVCRLPKPGMLTRIAKRAKFDLSASIMIARDWEMLRAGADAGVLGMYVLPEKGWTGFDLRHAPPLRSPHTS